MKKTSLLTILFVTTVWTAEASAQSKEDLLSGTPLNPQIVINALQEPPVSVAMAQCGAGKLSSGSVTMHVSVDASGAATLTKIEPVLPPDVTGCLGGIISSLELPPSGGGADVAFLFTFPATAPATVGQPVQKQYPPEYYSGKRLRRAGIGLTVPGAIFFGLGGLIMLVYFAAPSVGDDTTSPLYVGIGFLTIGAAFLVPGIAMAVIGRKRAEAAMRQASLFPMPNLALDPGTKSAHLTLTWRF